MQIFGILVTPPPLYSAKKRLFETKPVHLENKFVCVIVLPIPLYYCSTKQHLHNMQIQDIPDKGSGDLSMLRRVVVVLVDKPLPVFLHLNCRPTMTATNQEISNTLTAPVGEAQCKLFALQHTLEHAGSLSTLDLQNLALLASLIYADLEKIGNMIDEHFDQAA